MSDDSSKLVAKSALHFSFGTLLSRITGMGREVVMAFLFGTSPLIAAFMIAYRLALVMRRLLGEGALLVGFIPHFENIRSKSPLDAAIFFKNIYLSLSLFLLLFIGLLEGVFFLCQHHLFTSEANRQIIFLSMIILPGLFFICLSSLSSALLQCQKKFFLPSMTSVIFNLSWIASIVFFQTYHLFYVSVGLALGTVLAFFFQWLLVIPSTLAYIKQNLPKKSFFHIYFFSPEIKQMLSAISLSIIAVGASQINSFLDTIFARAASLEGPAYLNYAIRLYQFPLALVGISLSTALLPSLSRTVGTKDFSPLLSFSLKRASLLVIPGTFAIFVLGISTINLIYCRGTFTTLSTLPTTFCLWGFGLGLLPATFSLLMSQPFFAQKDFKTPMIGSLLSIAFNLLLNTYFIFFLHCESQSVAIATSLASCVNVLYLHKKWVEKQASVWTPLMGTLTKLLLCSILASLGSLSIGHFFLQDPTLSVFLKKSQPMMTSSFGIQLFHFTTLATCFFSFFVVLAYLFKLDEFFQLFKLSSFFSLLKKKIRA